MLKHILIFSLLAMACFYASASDSQIITSTDSSNSLEAITPPETSQILESIESEKLEIIEQPEQINLSAYTAEYKATWKAGWFPITIAAIRTLENKNGNWVVSLKANSSVADLIETSEFSINNNQILPVKYQYRTNGLLSKKLRNLEFNRTKEKVWAPYKKAWGKYKLTDLVQDRLSYQEQVRIDLMNNKKNLAYPVAYKTRLKSYEFEVVGESIMQFKQGPITVIEVKQNKLKHKESTRIWFAKDFEYLIVKLQDTKSNGVSHTLSLKHAQIGNKKLSGL